MIACTAIALLATPASGADRIAADPSADSRAQSLVATARVSAPVHCPTARGAVRFYRTRVNYWRDRMGTPVIHRSPSRPTGCPRYLAHVLQRKAYGLRKAYERYVDYHYHWWKWMPAKLQRVGACETGYGQRPGNFHWDSGTYVSFAGIIRGGYAEFAHALGLRSWDESLRELGRDPTPREQVLVTLALQARYGWGAWGCGGS